MTRILKNSRLALLASAAGVLLAVSGPISACTGIDFSLDMEGFGNGHYAFAGRTMEFGPDVTSWKLLYMPAGTEYTSCVQSGIKTCVQTLESGVHVDGHTWKVLYSYVGFTPMRPLRYKDAEVQYTMKELNDGINEKGLSCAGFYHMGTETYSSAPYRTDQRNVSDMDFISWVLGRFVSVKELRDALAIPEIVHVRQFDVTLFGIPITKPEKFPQLHYKVTDKTGASIIIEFIDGKPVITDSIGVITNNPTYDWQLTNLKNYVNLKADNYESVTVLGKDYKMLSNGTGLLGLPGDFTSPSRFVRAAFLLSDTLANNTIYTPEEAVLRAFRVLNQFDIPEGSVVEISTPSASGAEADSADKKDKVKVVKEATSWTSMADLVNLRYYYHTMFSRTIRMIDLPALMKRSAGLPPEPATIELPGNELILNVTHKFPVNKKD